MQGLQLQAAKCATSHIVSFSLHATRIDDGCQGAAYLAETIVCLQGR